MDSESYVYKKEVDWSVLTDGITLPMENQVTFGTIMGRYLQRGEAADIKIVLDGKTYAASIRNVNFSEKYKTAHKNDILQIRYTRNGEFSRALQTVFFSSYNYISGVRAARAEGDRTRIRVPEEIREYLAIYTTEYDDTYVVEAITVDEMDAMREEAQGKTETQMETDLNAESIPAQDPDAAVKTVDRTVKIRKLNRKIGENLKKLYGYRCQLCGELIGGEYGIHVCDAHHIDYFIKSLNNDASNQLIVCPNHHRIIHEANPVFDRQRLVYRFDNGMEAGLKLNKHLVVEK